MGTIHRRWQVRVTLSEKVDGEYGERIIGSTELAIPPEQEAAIGRIIQAHVRAIATTADATTPQAATTEPVLAAAAL